MAKGLINLAAGGTASSAAPVATYAVVGTVLIHAVILAGLSFVEVGVSSDRPPRTPQLQLRQGEHVVEVRLRPMAIPSEAQVNHDVVTPPQAISDLQTSSFPEFDQAVIGDLPSMKKVNRQRTATRPTGVSVEITPTQPIKKTSISSLSIESPRQPTPFIEGKSYTRLNTNIPITLLPDIQSVFKSPISRVEAEDVSVRSDRPTGVTSGVEIQDLPKPKYPSLSRRRGEQGTVVLHVEVHADGTAGTIRVIQDPGYERLVAAAISAARKGQFSPAVKNGRPVTSHVTIPFQFVLNR